MINNKKTNQNEFNDNTQIDGEHHDELRVDPYVCPGNDSTKTKQKDKSDADEKNKEIIKEIDSLESFYSWYKEKIRLLDELNKIMPFGNKFKLFFRGEEDNTYKLVPSIYRNGWITNEHRFYNESINKCPESFKECKTAFEKLAKMQHYKIPTRLLDVTENPLIALYFATNKSQKNNNGKFYCFFVSESAIKYPDDDITALLANAASVDIKKFYIRDFYDNTFAFIKKYKTYAGRKNEDTRNKKLKDAKNALNDNPVINEMLLKSQHDCGYSSSQYTFDDLAKVVCVKPKINNWRISNQNSAFLLFGFLLDKNYALPLYDLSQCFEFVQLLLTKFSNPKRRALEDSIILKLPLDHKILKSIINIKRDFSLISAASNRKRILSFEITKKISALFYDFLIDCQYIRLNTKSSLSTGRHFYGIQNKLSDYLTLRFFQNLIYKNEPLIFYDSIETNNNSKEKLVEDLSRIGISNDFIFPELENVSQVLRQRFEHKQPIVLENIGYRLVITHLSDYARENTKLEVGDAVLDFESQEDFLQKLSMTEGTSIKVIRFKDSFNQLDKFSANKLYYSKGLDYDKDLFEEKKLDIHSSLISSDDNPLFANDSDGSIL